MLYTTPTDYTTRKGHSLGENTVIAWCDHSFNIAWGCQKISPGCANCYADTLSKRYGHVGIWGKGADRRTFGAKHWQEPIKWNREAERAGIRRKVFCSSMCDNFEDHTDIIGELVKLWALIRTTPWLDWQLLTKRHDRIALSLPDDWGQGYPNVWLGVSVENDKYLRRVDTLRGIPATVRFVSYEPALGPIAHAVDLTGIDQVLYGGESGPGFRPEDKQWARDVMALCREQGTAFFHKQSAAHRTEMGIELDGEIVREYPKARRVPLTVGGLLS